MVPAAVVDVDARASSRRCSTEGDIIIDGGNSYYRDDIRRAQALKPIGHPLRRRRHQRRRLRPRARLLPDDRRRGRGRRSTSTRSSPRSRRASTSRAAHAGPTGDADHRRERLPPLRPERRRALREDGAQRHRVRPHGRVRRGPEHPAPRQRRQDRQREVDAETAPLREPGATTSTTSTSRASPRCGGAAASSRRGCSTSPPPRSASRRSSTDSRDGCPTRARAGGR